jgi:hypothetical protein
MFWQQELYLGFPLLDIGTGLAMLVGKLASWSRVRVFDCDLARL